MAEIAQRVIGIDPGIDTGIAIFIGGKLESLHTISPSQLLEYIRGASRVVMEDSRLTSFVFTTTMQRAAALKIARNIGEIDAWCKLINQICSDLGIQMHSVSPKGKGAKLNAAAFNALTGWDGPSNQHNRDAAMVAWRLRGAK